MTTPQGRFRFRGPDPRVPSTRPDGRYAAVPRVARTTSTGAPDLPDRSHRLGMMRRQQTLTRRPPS